MGKSSGGSAPSAPDPWTTSAAQQQLNNNTASFNARLNNVNQSGPLGSTSYTVTGTDPTTGAPIYSQQTSLNGSSQQALNNQQGNQSYATGLAGQALGNSGSLLTNPINPQGINQQATKAAYDSAYGLIAPQQQQQSEALKSEMAAQGITDPGSQAYQTASDNLARQQAYQNDNLAQQSVLTGIQAGNTAFNQNLGAQQQALSNFNGLNNQSIAMPSSSNPATVGSSPANIAGAYQNQYNAQLAGYNANQASNNNFTNGLFSLGSSYILGNAMAAAAASDIRLKTDIKRVGSTDGGLPVYTYRYKGHPTVYMGVMAQEVEKVDPSAVHFMPNGFKAVDYSKVA
ncbi:tail fiber domain-containing protein [Rhodoferax sp. GW822-FHT02A01]|uniref:tail fiber domain-containing protein n=1 Tax=Rhodoferax sp. GW822-FHT02A01 TaxID=3141537 RepID=UPI00315D3294